MTPDPPVARLVLRYGYGARGRFRPEILALDLLDVPPPLLEDDIPEGAALGAWLDVLAPGGELALQVEVPAPSLGIEAMGVDGKLARHAAGSGGATTAAVEVPWLGEGTRIVFRHADGSEVATRSVPGLASLELVPNTGEGRTRRPDELVRLPMWGADNSRAIALLFLAEAFRKEEEVAFANAVDTCLDAIGAALARVSPARDLRRAFAPFRLMLASKDSGIDVAPRRTGLGARWRDADPQQRLILIDEEKAARHHSAVGRSRSVQAIAIVNTQRYGGSGGATAVTSCDPAAMGEVLVHELGHSLFKLGDEYIDEQLVPTMGEPVAANVTGQFAPATLKWRRLVTPGAPLPTPPLAPMPAVGAYEGAFYASRGRFRPSFTCKMRDAAVDFCPVCADAIMQRLSPHL